MVSTGTDSKLFIGGRWVEARSTETLTVTSPFTTQPIASVPSASVPDVDAAVAAARQAFDHGDWPRTSLKERIAVLSRVSDALGARADEIASLVTDEMGCPITLSRSMQAAGPKVVLDTFLELAPDYPWVSERQAATGRSVVLREPVGVVAAVVPWNAPLLISIMKLAPALLAGCTVVLKPAPQTPLDAYLLAELLSEAGLPDGVVNVVPADREVSEHLVAHPEIDKVAFTGSTAAGRRIASLCGHDLKRVTLELGGKSAAVLLDDADFGPAVEQLRTGSFRNSGQVCSLKTRIIVPRSREREFLDAFSAMVSTMPVGDPTDPDTQIGPLVSDVQRGRVEGYIRSGRDQGAQVVLGGGRPSGLGDGWFVEPTVFAGVDPSMTIAQEEIFGPVVSVLAYDDVDEAVAIANDSAYGLNGSVFTGDPQRGFDVARRIRTGTVELNGSPVGFHAPIGGFKSSGIGREAGPEGFDAYVEIKSVGLPKGFVPTVHV
ncbi:aldehyde dehydrogenase [Pseudonocardia endophytica]|uniref:Acyl-CoA reductase-like NAD-dependent aldehyde dehydrogenase n=1 Tax=Pseudonocardia endophytica TaxID=401976 RepID=A0A4V2PIS1_PSEEN|nr:aldehyde dehydrogenase [Pseudonocardia endophytica]TCK25776.1 acyl-CoA reductase-like NAD-dependent aldehyde dehydrogenase [Pseudonocardia endophytica]